jgi:NDP-sugar pyrophosphorylase family protein
MVASIPYSVKIPYAVFDIVENQIISIKEKPTLTYYSNAGIYLINKKVLKYIPKDKFYDATDLIEDLIKQGKKVNYYPIHGLWIDIGSHDDYIKANKYIEQNEI